MMKRLCISRYKKVGQALALKALLTGLLCCGLLIDGVLYFTPVSALTYSQAVDVSFDFNPTLSVSVSSADLVIPELVPGSVADSNIITVGVSTNASFGYTLSANVGNNSKYDTRSLIRADDDTSEFASIATDATMSAITTDNAWGFSSKLTTDGASWANYSGLPLYSDTENTKTILETSSPQDANTVDFKIAARAGNMITAGEYKNVINFIAVAKPEPTPAPIACEAEKICYSKNALDTVEGSMGYQTGATANSSVTLIASNYSRAGYGFAGWNTAPDYSGASYGPNEDVTMPADMSNGLSLYAMWVRSSGVMQDWGGCVGLNIGDVTALTDTRDGDVYAVAKLADGNCWMIENLRLADTHQEGVNTVPTTLTTLNTNNPLNDNNLTNPTVTLKHNYTDTETYNTLSATSSVAYDETTAPEGWCTTNSAACDDQSRIRTDNTANRATYTAGQTMSIDASLYSYGNYYNWYSATAGRGTYAFSTNNDSTAGDLCPTNWRLPKGGSKTRIVSNDDNDFWNLVVDTLNGGVVPANYTSNANPYYTGAGEAGPVDALIRTWPNNFVYSGGMYGATLNRGSYGYYWSSTAASANYAYPLYFYSKEFYPGTYNYNMSFYKYIGRTIRCMVSPGA